ncbi:hypothetical protein [Pseudomonas sp. DWP3-1-2]|jgi:hypothetical protein|uniref:hypothetical protein n=1 Tax=Pseudomonas sp. DWP3-1-2 TaxID=2804645 RepID=UPI003CF50A97
MSLLSLTPAFTLNLFALLAACPGVALLCATRNRERRELKHLAVLSALSQIDEPMHLMDGASLRMNRLCYRVGAACLGFALLMSWVSTWL